MSSALVRYRQVFTACLSQGLALLHRYEQASQGGKLNTSV